MHRLHDGDERLQFVILHYVCGLALERFQDALATIYRYVTADVCCAAKSHRERKSESERKKETENMCECDCVRVDS